MTQQERWDVVLKVLNGPLAASGEQVVRGPVVRLGANPGPGGLKLGGYRGLDARQATITAYTGGTASVAPVGTNQVRLAPHPNVNWSEIDPIGGPEYLSPGAAVHLGPVGRGATVEFVECRRLGQWQEGRLASDVAEVQGGAAVRASAYQGAMQATRHLPAAYDARRVGRIQSSYAPFWFLGCAFLLSTAAGSVILALGLALIVRRNITKLGPVEEGVEFYDHIDLAIDEVDPLLYEGLHQAFFKFVMEPNIAAAEAESRGFEKPETWDTRFFEYTTASVNKHVQSWAFFTRLESVHVEYAKVVLATRKAGLPEVFAAIPYQESRYQPSITSEVCAEGYWQFMPEVAYRLGTLNGMDFRVANCTFRGAPSVLWSPTELAPPRGVRENGPYMDAGQCMIERCQIDDRKDLEKSTAAALFTLGEAWKDPLLAGSLSNVQLTISSHNAGYDDGRFGDRYKKRVNIKPAYASWIASHGESAGIQFVGQQIRCPGTGAELGTCDSALAAETQHYAYTIVAQHILAVCYYAKNYGEEAAFQPWRVYVGDEGYCKAFKIPSKDEVRGHKPAAPRGGAATPGGTQ